MYVTGNHDIVTNLTCKINQAPLKSHKCAPLKLWGEYAYKQL